MGEKEEGNGSCAVEEGEIEEVKVVRSRLMWEAFLPTRAMVASGPGVIFGSWFYNNQKLCTQLSMAQLPPGAIGMLNVWAATCSHMGLQELCQHQNHSDMSGLCFSLQPRCCPGLSCCSRAMSRSMVLQHLGSMLMCVASVTSENHSI